jgi:chromosome segregation ATPase
VIRILVFFLVLLLSGLEAGAEQGSVDEEIARVKKELAKIESERSKVKKERAKDKAEFDSYQSRTARKSPH